MKKDANGKFIINIDLRSFLVKKPFFLRLFIFILIFSWLFSGWPQVFDRPSIMPDVIQVKAAVPSGVIVAWPGARASIPGGWSAVPELNGMFVEGTIANPSVATQGAASHTHAAEAHQHDLGGHTHSGTTGNAAGSGATGNGTGAAIDAHTHAITTAGNIDLNIATASNFQTESNDPPYAEVVWIKSDGTQNIPDGAWAFLASTSLPVNWATASEGRFLKGAPGGGDGGSTGGISDSHIHTDSGHTHLENSHTHTGTTDVPSATKKSAAGSGYSSGTQTHTISGGGFVATESSGTGNLAVADARPPWYSLTIVQNNTGGYDLPYGAIAMWDQATDSIPAGWELCDGSGGCPNLDGKFIIGASATVAVGTSGGLLTHTHSAGASHTHAINSHAHNFTVDGDTSGQVIGDKTGSAISTYTHTHTLSISSGGTTGGQTAIANENTENRPLFKEVVFIRYTAVVVSLSISDATTIAYGVMSDNATKDTTISGMNNSKTVTNDGGATETFLIRGQDSANWILAASSGNDQYVHQWCMINCDSSPTWTALTLSNATFDSGIGVGATRNLDLKITTPSPSTTTATQSVDVTMTAVAQ